MAIMNKTLSEIKSELKPSKIVAFVVMLLVAGWILAWASKRFALIGNLNKLQTK